MVTYEHEWTVRFYDADPYDIANYTDIVDAIADVSDRFMAEIGYSWATLARDYDAGMPLVEVHVEFDAPIRPDDVVTITLTPELGDRSARYRYEGRLPDGTVAFTGYEQRAFVDKGGDSASRIPDYLREAIAAYDDPE